MTCTVGVPNLLWFGVDGEYNVLAIDLLGPSLQELKQYCGGKLSLKSVLMLGQQMITRLEFVHARNHVHRDVKPSNFLMGTGESTIDGPDHST